MVQNGKALGFDRVFARGRSGFLAFWGPPSGIYLLLVPQR